MVIVHNGNHKEGELMAAKRLGSNLFSEQDSDDTAQVMRRKLFIERMERKLEFKKSLRNTHYHPNAHRYGYLS